MSTFLRFAVTFKATIAIAIGGYFYNTIYADNLRAYAPESGPFAAPVGYLDYIVPIVLATMLLAVWTWMIYGVVQQERAVEQRRVPR